MSIQLNKIPATVVTGFLGSGKTTLLSNVIKQAKGKRLAIIVNEFGELDTCYCNLWSSFAISVAFLYLKSLSLSLSLSLCTCCTYC